MIYRKREVSSIFLLLQGCEDLERSFAYVASKWAVRGMTRTAAAELGSSNVRVNSIHPGAIETDMLFDLGEDSINWLVSKVPQRSGTPDEVGETAMFLLSDEASYIRCGNCRR